MTTIEKFISGIAAENREKGRYVISDIAEYGCEITTVVRYRINEKKMRATVRSTRFIPNYLN